MSPMAIRYGLRRQRRKLAYGLAVLAVVSAVAIHHAEPMVAHGNHSASMTMAMDICLGALTLAGTALAVAVGCLALISRRRLWMRVRADSARIPSSARHDIRAGPGHLHALGVLRL